MTDGTKAERAHIGTYVLRVAALLVADEFDMTTVADNERFWRECSWFRTNGSREGQRATEGGHVYIGIGTLVIILLAVLIFYFVRRA